jgi:hypothetical protein
VSLTFGFVTAQFVRAVGDLPSDPDAYPNLTPASGTVTFTPTSTGFSDLEPSPVTIIPEPISATLDGQGFLVDNQGRQGVWLVAGLRYNVTMTFLNRPFPIDPKDTHTKAAPLDLTVYMPLVPSDGIRFVVNEQVYLDTVAARNAAIAAAQKAESIANGIIPGGGDGGETVVVTWANVKPPGGVVKADLAPAVQLSLGLADTATQPEDLAGYVKSVNGAKPDSAGNVAINVGGGTTDPGTGGGSAYVLTDDDVAALLNQEGSLSAAAVTKLVKTVTGVGGTPASITRTLNIGPLKGQNHFLLQVAPIGAPAFETKTQQDLVDGYSLDPNFKRVVETDGISRVEMVTRMDGATTSGSSYSRTELREVEEDGVTLVGFDYTTGTHWIRGRTRINKLSAIKPEVVIAQLHNGAADRIAIRTQLISGAIKLLVRVNGSSITPRLEETYILGTEFEWMIRVKDGVASIFYKDMLVPMHTTTALTPTAGITTWYFKAGNYAQSNVALGEAPTDTDVVQLRSLQHWHTGWADPDPVGSYRVTGGL